MTPVPCATLRAQIEAILAAWGMPAPTRRITAEAMADTDLLGIDSHGISMLPMYEKLRQAGTLRLAAEPRVVRETPAAAVIDAGAGLGHPAAAMAADLAAEKARALGIGAVGVVNSHHFGAAGSVRPARGRRRLLWACRLLRPRRAGGADRRGGTHAGHQSHRLRRPASRGCPFCPGHGHQHDGGEQGEGACPAGQSRCPPAGVVDGAGQPVTDPEAAWALIGGAVAAGRRPEGG